jgi:RNA polymerase sigma-70 factor (ECF subfamily)
MSQEAFLRAFDRLHQFDPTRPLLPWLRRVATNVCLNALERDKRLVFSLDDENATEPPADDALRPEMAAARRQAAADVRAALTSLPPHYRAVIELCHFQDLSYAEAAEVLRLPLSDVKSHLFRARKRLARLLEDV